MMLEILQVGCIIGFHLSRSMKLIGSEIGAMGMGIPAGVAAALRYPNRQVFSLLVMVEL
jgi:thiamine pyrophosphate-dependent acetolactate synthase large subunit-like protein